MNSAEPWVRPGMYLAVDRHHGPPSERDPRHDCPISLHRRRKNRTSVWLASQRISDISKQHRFQSVAVAGPQQTEALLDELLTLDEASRKVLHLFIAVNNFSRALATPKPGTTLRGMLDLQERHWAKLFRLVAPTLRTLSVMSYNPIPGLFLHPLGKEETVFMFPQLTHLTYQHAGYRGLCSLGHSSEVAMTSLDCVRMPRLQVLHSSSRAACSYICLLVSNVARHSPELEQVLLSDFYMQPWEQDSIRRLLGLLEDIANIEPPGNSHNISLMIEPLAENVRLRVRPEIGLPRDNLDVILDIFSSSERDCAILDDRSKETDYDDFMEERISRY
ncbi:hypothetical protein PUNSTDRAFT_131768 [Punctularia strigosozonata HHB-11173 SS5]|uniref:uncharacterized protein n=1 Tax=Punctularia strigosozonata (strain HHB-11173) TaxID=741275 RepID=UPI0004417F8C|nr:uncharacterized protein PUNSTDRAFT_131768 [Punctularia strigosozonata HHB-11173 SS5]EIN11609.1 hypothetical protein PUNSTDRAFT_131768 [Punctularia strigosozonata HHB-11173 SS5]